MIERMVRIVKREIVTALAKVGLRQVRTDYMGMRLVVPTIRGMVNGGYLVPAENWMSDCLDAAVQTKTGCVLDVGSSVGVYLVKLRVLSDDIAYYGVEPNHASNLYVQELIRLNGFKNASILPFVFSDRKGTGTLYVGGLGSKKGSTLPWHLPAKDLAHSFDAYFTPGDEIVEALGIEALSIIKLDVEEAELEALRGLQRTIRRLRPYLYCEVLDPGDDPRRVERAAEIQRMVQGLDYVILGVTRSDGTLVEIPQESRFGEDHGEEYVFAPREDIPAFLQAIRGNGAGVRVGVSPQEPRQT